MEYYENEDENINEDEEFNNYINNLAEYDDNSNHEQDVQINNKKIANKSKNTTYSDILSNLNIVIVNGKLKLLKKNDNTINTYFTQQPNNYNDNIPNKALNTNILSPEEIKKINAIRYINWLKEKQRISMIKPRTMFFNNGNITKNNYIISNKPSSFPIKPQPTINPSNIMFKKKF